MRYENLCTLNQYVNVICSQIYTYVLGVRIVGLIS